MSAVDDVFNTIDNAYPALDHAFSAVVKACGTYSKPASSSDCFVNTLRLKKPRYWNSWTL